MLHTSIDFPSHLVLWLEVGFVLVALGVGVCFPKRARLLAGLVLRVVARAPAGGAGVASAGLLAFLGTASLSVVLGGHPIAGCPDEHAYLISAETFAAGHLTNPPVEHPGLVAQHCLAEPVHIGKYPVGQSLTLAIGYWLGHPGYALWLHSAMLAMAAAWCLRGWLPHRWVSLGTVLIVLRLAVGSYWNQTYWGGSVAAIGGFLAFGALGRIERAAPLANGLVLGAGFSILATTRPFEGFLASAPLGLYLLWRLVSQPNRRAETKRLAGIGLLLLPTLGLIAAHNAAVTGSAWKFPHTLYAEQTTLPGEFVWQRLDTEGRLQWYEGDWEPAGGLHWVPVSAQLTLRRMATTLQFLLGPAISLLLLIGSLLFVLRARADRPRSPGSSPEPRQWVLLAAAVAVSVAHGLVQAYFPHYSAPLTAPLWLLALLAARALTLRPPSAVPWLPIFLVASLPLQVSSTTLQLPAYRHDGDDTAHIRAVLTERLRQAGGRHLVLVERGHGMAVFNHAEPKREAVIWAIDVSEPETLELLQANGDRTLWRWRGGLGEDLEPLEPR